MEGVKKKLDLAGRSLFIEEGKDMEKKIEDEAEEKNQHEKMKEAEAIKTQPEEKKEVEEKKIEVQEREETQPVNLVVELGCKKEVQEKKAEWELAVGSLENVVAYATVDTASNVLHGKPLVKENARVSITRVIQGSAKIPFPIEDEIMTVEQALGTYIAWPRQLISEVKTSVALVNGTPKVVFYLTYITSSLHNMVYLVCHLVSSSIYIILLLFLHSQFFFQFFQGGKKNAGRRWKKVTDCVQEPKYVVEFGADYPPSLKRLWLWAKDALTDGRTITFHLREEAFASTNKQVLFLSDIHALCSGGEISGSVICLFIK